jgi:hypothetical protein
MSTLTVFVDAVGVIGPGLSDWAQTRAVLSAQAPYAGAPTVIPASPLLPPAERRRVGTAVKLAMAAAADAFKDARYQASDLISVFSSSGGDGDNCHVICEALASSDRLISPTRFTNSVHNAPSGYWGIAAQARPASTSLCAYDASFGSGFIESCTQALAAQAPVLLIAYDTPYPEPLHTSRPIAHSFGVAMVLSPTQTPSSAAQLQVSLGTAAITAMSDAALEALRAHVPAARVLPLLQALAGPRAQDTVIDYFDNQQLLVRVEPLA